MALILNIETTTTNCSVCIAKEGVVIRPIIEGGDITVQLSERVLGRVLVEDAVSPLSH